MHDTSHHSTPRGGRANLAHGAKVNGFATQSRLQRAVQQELVLGTLRTRQQRHTSQHIDTLGRFFSLM